MNSKEILAFLESTKAQEIFKALYAGEEETNKERYRNLVNKFEQVFGDRDICLFSSPGRTEISGNHTDHNQCGRGQLIGCF